MGRDDTKRYYWLKLDRNFFKRHDIRIVEAMPNGKDYILFYLKLICESTSHEGRLRFSDTIPYNENMLATLTDTNVDIVRAAMEIFTELGMIQVLDDQTIYMAQVEKMIGSESHSTRRKRIYQESVEIPMIPEDTLEKWAKSAQSCPKSATEKEIEKELDIPPKSPQGADTEFAQGQMAKWHDQREEIVAYLNARVRGKYRPHTDATAKHINARLAEGFTVDDFKRVIDAKADEWLNNSKMQKYLRPGTLFAGKFEGYLSAADGLSKYDDMGEMI